MLMILTVTTVYASVPMIGKKVDAIYPIFIDNVRLSKDAVVIEGVSYIPVRIFAESVGYDIGFKNKQIFLSKKGKKAADHLLQILDIKSNVIEIGSGPDPITKERVIGEEYYITKDDVGYLRPRIFNNYLKWDKETNVVTISLPGREPLVYNQDNYFENPGILYIRGDIYIKLSALGLKPRIEGNTLWLENI